MTEIYLIRHAEAEENIFRRFHGQYDSLLTPRGHRQLAYLEKRFADIPIDGCFSSDLTRTSLTAGAVYKPKNLKLIRDPRLREIHIGIWEDIPYGYLDHFEAEEMTRFNHDPMAWHVPGGEDFDVHTQRFLEGMEAAAQRFDGGTIAVFAHGAVIRNTLLRLFFGKDMSKLGFSDNTGVCKLRYHKGNFSYDYLNDNSHIPEELSTFYIQRWWRTTGRRKESALYFLPEGYTGGDCTMTAVLSGNPVGRIVMAKPDADTGIVLSMDLIQGFDGRYYGDQLLGCAVSHFRRLGCKNLRMEPGDYPNGIFERYAFDIHTRCRGIDPKIYQLED